MNYKQFSDLFDRVYPNQSKKEMWDFIETVIIPFQKPLRVLEIGVEQGGSGCIWSYFCLNGGFYVGVDLDCSKGMKRIKGEYGNRLKSYFVEGNSANVSTIRQVKEILELEKCLFNFVFIDGNHSYDFVYSDVRNYYPFLEKGGILALHDYLNSEVKRALSDLKDNRIVSFSKEGLFAAEDSIMGIYYGIKNE